MHMAMGAGPRDKLAMGAGPRDKLAMDSRPWERKWSTWRIFFLKAPLRPTAHLVCLKRSERCHTCPCGEALERFSELDTCLSTTRRRPALESLILESTAASLHVSAALLAAPY
jgi:hypothetical protein